MKKKFLKSSMILLAGGLFTKLLSMILKIIMIRTIGEKTFGFYMLLLPTFSLLIQLGQAGFPIAFAKLIAEEKRSSKELFFSILPFLVIIHIFLMGFVFLFAPYLSQYLFHQKEFTKCILAMSFVIPFTSLSSICRSYFFGKGQMIPHVLSNITEDLVRMILFLFFLPSLTMYSSSFLVTFLILANVISEFCSLLILLFFLPKKIHFQKEDFLFHKNHLRDSLQISIPNTGSRFMGSIGYFLEPIILTSVLHSHGYSLSYITTQYGILTGYVLPILLLPSFFTVALAQSLFPILSKEFSSSHFSSSKRKIKYTLGFSFLLGLLFTSSFLLFPHFFLSLLFHTNEGVSYLRFLSLFFLFQYVQSILSTSLDAMGKSKDIFTSVLLGTVVRIVTLALFSSFSIGLWGYLFSTACHIIITTIYLMRKVLKHIS